MAFQNHVPVNHRYHSVDYLRLHNPGKQQEDHEMEVGSHQKVCPILKKKLKCFNTCEEGDRPEQQAQKSEMPAG